MTEKSESKSRKAWNRFVYWLAIIAGLLGILGWNLKDAFSDEPGEPGSGESSSQSEATSPDAPTTAAPSPSDEPVVVDGSATAEPPPPDIAYLVDLERNDSHLDVDEGTVSVMGDEYDHSLRYYCDLYCDGESPGGAEYVIGGGYDRLVFLAGVSAGADEGDQEGFFQVFLDDEPVFPEPVAVTRGEPEPIDVSVEGATWLRIEAYREGTVDDPMQAGANFVSGVSNKLPDLVWARPVLCRAHADCDEWAEF